MAKSNNRKRSGRVGRLNPKGNGRFYPNSWRKKKREENEIR